MSEKDELRNRRKRFCYLYAVLGDPEEAAVRAGYSRDEALGAAMELLKNPVLISVALLLIAVCSETARTSSRDSAASHSARATTRYSSRSRTSYRLRTCSAGSTCTTSRR